MRRHSQFTFSNYRNFSIAFFFFLFIFIISPPSSAQNEGGVSIHADFFSTVFTYGYDHNYNHPGNFLLGGQYNYPVSPLFEINGGLDIQWMELYGKIGDVHKQAEVFIPFVFAGAALNFDDWRVFGKLGVSLGETTNILGSGKGWNSSILDFYMGTFQFGIKFPIYNALSLSTSAGYYFNDRIKVETRKVIFSTFNVGLSYNLFHSEVTVPVVETGVDVYKEKYYAAQSENKELFKQIINLHDRVRVLESARDTVSAKDIVSTEGTTANIDKRTSPVVPVRSISIDSINNVYNLHIREPLNLKDFVNKKGLKEEGKLILEEYNNIAATFKGLPAGLYLVCTVSNIKAFKKNEREFPRIQFRQDASVNNKLVIDIDSKATEKNNIIKLEIK
jgi:hypothetical protein